jgi:hypothetical protein
MSLMSSVRMTSASVSRLEENYLSKRKTTQAHLAEEFVVVGEYALDQLESNSLVEVLEL